MSAKKNQREHSRNVQQKKIAQREAPIHRDQPEYSDKPAIAPLSQRQTRQPKRSGKTKTAISVISDPEKQHDQIQSGNLSTTEHTSKIDDQQRTTRIKSSDSIDRSITSSSVSQTESKNVSEATNFIEDTLKLPRLMSKNKNKGTGIKNQANKQVIDSEATTKNIQTVDTTTPVRPKPMPALKPLKKRHTPAIRMLLRKRRTGRLGSRRSRFLTGTLISMMILFLLFGGGLSAAFVYYQMQLPLLNGIAQHSLFQTTRIFDRNGVLLYELYDHQVGKGRRTYIDYKDISPLLIKATIAAEDHTFWTNSGVDYMGITRAALSNLEKKGVVEGGSTITQQLIKNLYFQGQPRTVQIKMQEAVLATGLTHQYPKWKIMEMYLNTVYYGDTNYGVEAAAEGIFGVEPECSIHGCKPVVAHLTLAQASLLAGLPQSPTTYNPVRFKERALARQAQVLTSMVELGQITPQQKSDAQKETTSFIFHTYRDTHKMLAPHFVNYVIDQLTSVLGADTLSNGGYNIYTTLDYKLEQKVEEIVYNHLYTPQQDNYLGYYGPLYRTNNVNNGAVVVMDPATGEILAMDGSASTDPDKQTAQMQGDYNAAIAPRQPGSSFKPIVYATAFEMGWYPAMIVPDHKTYYPNGNDKPYSPQNYDGTFHSGYPMTIRTAVANSFNIPAITTIQFTGLPNVLNMAGRLGLSEVASRQLNTLGPSMALGSVEVTPLHMTAAYSTFANKGVRVPTVYIQSITDNEGHEIYRFDKNKVHGQRVLSEDVAFLISSMLSDKQARYHEFFPGNPLEADRPAAVKTGTTDSFRDNWTIGYTPHLTVGVWAGNSDNTIMNNVIGITGAGPIWHEVMTYASQNYNLPPDDFVPPSNVHKGSVSALTGLMPRPGEPTVSDWFIDGTQPTLISDAPLAPPKIIICPVDQNGIPVDISQCVPDPGNRDDGNTNDGHNGHHHQSDPSDPFTFNLPPGTVLIPDQPWPPGTITIPGQSQSPGTNSTPGQSQPSGQPKATKKKH